MAFTHGKDSVFSLDNAAGSLTDISQYVNSIDGLPGDVDMAETTTLGKEAKTYIAGLSDASISISGVWDSALDAIVGTPTQQKTIRSFEYGPQGSTATNIKYSGEAFISSYTTSSPVGDVVTYSITLQCSDAITRGVY